MDSELIPAVCPNCGGKLQVDPGADALTCQFCGTEHLIRRNVGGAVTLEAFARCPLCKRNDRVEKVSAILLRETRQSEGFIPQQRVVTDSQGRSVTRTENVPIQTIQTSALARQLTPPPPPADQVTSRPVSLALVAAILLLVLGMCAFGVSLFGVADLLPSYHRSQLETLLTYIAGGIVCGILPGLVSIGLFALWFFLRGKDEARKKLEQAASLANYRKWQQARARWEALYYCGRDDIVFIPGEKTSAPVAKMHAYMLDFPAKD